MADNEQTSNRTNAFKPIVCRSKRVVNEINSVVTSSFDTLANENVYWSTEEKELCKNRFNEVFVSSALQYVSINGEIAANVDDDEEETSEIEQVNQNRADYYREELPQQVYDQLKDLVERRKRVPYSCARHIATQSKHQQSYLVKLKYAEVSKLNTAEDNSKTQNPDNGVIDSCKQIAESLSASIASISKTVGEMKSLRDSLDMLDRIGGTRTDKVLYDSNTTPRKMSTRSSTCSPLRERLESLNNTPASLRASTRLSDKDKLRNRQLVSSKGYSLRNLPPS